MTALPPRIDAHQHYWQLGRSDYAWMAEPHAAIRRDFMPPDLAPLLRAANIAGTVLVQADATARETDFLLDVAACTPNVLGVVGWVDFTAADAVAEVERRTMQSPIRGLRPMLEFIDDPDWILQPGFDPVFRAMIRGNLRFDALIHPPHLPAILTLAQRYPDLSIVIDHGGKPKIAAWQGQRGGAETWGGGLRALAACPNVWCKLSGLLTEAGKGWQAADLLPYMMVLRDLFGPDRLIWGSDWPVMTLAGSYADWLNLTAQALHGLTPDEDAAIRGGNALRFYGLQV
jgi:L-fuconolactonase